MQKSIFIVDDEPSILKLLNYWLKDKWRYMTEQFTNAEDMLNNLNKQPDLILLDIMLPGIDGVETLKRIKAIDPDLPVIMLSAQNSIDTAVNSIKLGAYDYFSKPIDQSKLEISIKNALKSYDLARELQNLKDNVEKEFKFENIISVDKKMQSVFKLVSKVLDNDITVLIYGESGTGKELIARAIHYNGIRKDKPFVAVNCASIPRELLESELFGHEKGSFTGAHQRKLGKFEIANSGTIFLDEVGELEMVLQAKLLRVIQQREFERVGGTELIKTDVRIISATNKDLKKAVDQKMFREDLYYRLNSFPIQIPPLRERRSDIIVLAEHFLKKFNEKLNKNIKGFTKKALKAIYDYSWQGNIREMENTIERCMIIAEGDYIDLEDLPQSLKIDDNYSSFELSTPMFPGDTIIPFEKVKEETLRHALKVTDGNINEAAKKLKIGRATIYRLLDKYGISN